MATQDFKRGGFWQDAGALVEYSLLAALLLITVSVSLYRFYQQQTRPFCELIATLEGASFGKNGSIDWGASPTDSNNVACYRKFQDAYSQQGKGKTPPQVKINEYFLAGTVQIGF